MNDHIILLDFLGMPNCFWWWLLCSLGAFLLGWLLHWLLFCKSLKDQIVELTAERDNYHSKFTAMEKDYFALKYKNDELEKDHNGVKSALRLCEADKSILQGKLDRAAGEGPDIIVGGGTDGGSTGYAAILGTDNLQIVEGIGPKIEGLLKDGGITDWKALAGASYEKLQGILEAAGSRYRMHDSKTWPKQAQLAADGKWDELIEFQKFTDAGRETTGSFETPAKVEKLLVKKLGFSTNPQDLKVVEGIGPKIEGLLKEDGNKTWSDLSKCTEGDLQGILDKAGDKYRLADPSTWPKQAKLATESKWDELKKYQEFLKGGKNPK
jgi:predicted flap endonuclease-1-like 5' DNA nuclease